MDRRAHPEYRSCRGPAPLPRQTDSRARKSGSRESTRSRTEPRVIRADGDTPQTPECQIATPARILTHLGINGARYEEILAMVTGVEATQWIATTLPEQRQQNAALIDFE